MKVPKKQILVRQGLEKQTPTVMGVDRANVVPDGC